MGRPMGSGRGEPIWQTSLRLPDSLRRRLEGVLTRQVSLSHYILQAIQEKLERDEQTAGQETGPIEDTGNQPGEL